MSDLVEKVARAIFTELGWEKSDLLSWRHLEGEAQAAIAVVLSEMMERFHVLGPTENDKVWKDTLRAFAAVHSIKRFHAEAEREEVK